MKVLLLQKCLALLHSGTCVHSICSAQNLELETELASMPLRAYSEYNAEGSPNQADIQLPAKAVFSKVIKCKKIKPESNQIFFFFFLIYFHRIYTSVLASFQSPMMCGSNSRLVTNFPHRSTSGNLTRLLIQIARENERGLAQKGFAALRIFCLLLFTTMVFVLFICSLLF